MQQWQEKVTLQRGECRELSGEELRSLFVVRINRPRPVGSSILYRLNISGNESMVSCSLAAAADLYFNFSDFLPLISMSS